MPLAAEISPPLALTKSRSALTTASTSCSAAGALLGVPCGRPIGRALRSCHDQGTINTSTSFTTVPRYVVFQVHRHSPGTCTCTAQGQSYNCIISVVYSRAPRIEVWRSGRSALARVWPTSGHITRSKCRWPHEVGTRKTARTSALFHVYKDLSCGAPSSHSRL